MDMSPTIEEKPPPAAYAIRARNISVNAENAIHNDEGARSLGFAGGLVSGVTVYAYLTRPLVARFGTEALEGTTQRTAFFAPVYEGDALRIESTTAPESLAHAVRVQAAKADGEAVALLEVERPALLPEPAALPAFQPRGPEEERPRFAWDAVAPGRAFRGFLWRPAAEEQRAWCESVQDDLPLYREGARPPCHPGWVLQQANQAISREFRMTPWIHVSSRIVWRGLPRVGEAIEVRAEPRETWEKDGNRFVLLHVALAAAGRPLLEIAHKAILQVASR